MYRDKYELYNLNLYPPKIHILRQIKYLNVQTVCIWVQHIDVCVILLQLNNMQRSILWMLMIIPANIQVYRLATCIVIQKRGFYMYIWTQSFSQGAQSLHILKDSLSNTGKWNLVCCHLLAGTCHCFCTRCIRSLSHRSLRYSVLPMLRTSSTPTPVHSQPPCARNLDSL